MEVARVVLCMAFAATAVFSTEKQFEIISNFIRTSTTPAVSFVTFEENNVTEVLANFPMVPKTILRKSEVTLDECSSFANTDFYEYSNSTRKVSTLIEFLKQIEFNDFVIFTSSQLLESILHCIVHPLTRFLIILTSEHEIQTIRQMTSLLNRTWSANGALKVFISSRDELFTYDPFHRNDDESFGKLNSLTASFEESVENKLRKLNGYPLRVEIFPSAYTLARTKHPTSVDDFDGPDVDIARMTSDVLNATILFVKNDGAKFGFRLPNGTLTGALKAIQQRTCDVAFVTFFIKDYETRSIQFSAPVYSDELCLIVRKAGRIPQFILPLVTFDKSLWIALAAFLILGITFWCSLRFINSRIYRTFAQRRIKFNLPSCKERTVSTVLQYAQIFVDTLILFLNAPLRRFPRVQSERIFAGAICLLSLNIVSIFQSGLATCYVKPMFYRNVETLEEFAETKKSILVKYPAMMTDLFPEDSSELFRTLYRRMVLVPDTGLTAYNVTNTLNMAGVTRKTTVKIQREEDIVHLVPECPRSYHLSYIYARHWALGEDVDKIILHLKQGGIVGKWVADVHFRIDLEKSRSMEPTAHHRMLRVDDLMLAFMILMGGCVLSFGLFLLELALKRRSFKYLKYLP